MFEKINNSLNNLKNLLSETPDLKDDVFPFISSTLSKLEELAQLNIEKDSNINYEIFQIATNYLPRTIQGYCSFPLEYRNKEIIKVDKTPRDLMIADLIVLKKQVKELEKNVFSDLEREVRSNSTFLKNKYDEALSLATEVEKNDEQFINHFDINKVDTKFITYFGRKNISSQKQDRKEKNKENWKTLKNKFIPILKVIKNTGLFIYSNLVKLWKTGVIPVVSIIGTIIYVVFFLFIPWASSPSFQTESQSDLINTYNIMKSTVLSSEQVKGLAQNHINLLTDKAHIAKNNFNIFNNGKTLNETLNNYDQSDCKYFIDLKEKNMPNAVVSINGIRMPERHVYSEVRYFDNNNHKLCYLDKNTITVSLDAEVIHNLGNNEMISNEEIQKYLDMDEQQLKTVASRYKEGTFKEDFDQIKKLKEQHPIK